MGAASPWDDAVAEVGFGFPADYRDFVDVYGAGAVNDELFIAAPTLRPNGFGFRTGFGGFVDQTTLGLGRSIAEMRENAVALEDEETYPFPILPEPGGLLIWGNTANGDVCFWDTREAEPDRWPVVVLLLSSRRWDRFDGGMTEFLLAVLRGDHPFAERLIDPTGKASDRPVWDRHFGWDG
ncbi:MAG: SMI1/KNR4 family protein [Catenulisporales bacterium]|nr:SMI1/KNR4 family protein [Catenulisporales bacterium]